MEKKKGVTRKKLKESIAQRKSTEEWYERDMGAKASGFANSTNLPHYSAGSLRRFQSTKDMNGRIEGHLTEETACDMNTGEMMGIEVENRWERTSYWDEEEVFNMPVLINSMAEGLLITPPALQTGFNWLPPETPFHFTLWAD